MAKCILIKAALLAHPLDNKPLACEYFLRPEVAEILPARISGTVPRVVAGGGGHDAASHISSAKSVSVFVGMETRLTSTVSRNLCASV